MVAGAGSGKTTSLVKALATLARKHDAELRRNRQRVACITSAPGLVTKAVVWSRLERLPMFPDRP